MIFYIVRTILALSAAIATAVFASTFIGQLSLDRSLAFMTMASFSALAFSLVYFLANLFAFELAKYWFRELLSCRYNKNGPGKYFRARKKFEKWQRIARKDPSQLQAGNCENPKEILSSLKLHYGEPKKESLAFRFWNAEPLLPGMIVFLLSCISFILFFWFAGYFWKLEGSLWRWYARLLFIFDAALVLGIIVATMWLRMQRKVIFFMAEKWLTAFYRTRLPFRERMDALEKARVWAQAAGGKVLKSYQEAETTV